MICFSRTCFSARSGFGADCIQPGLTQLQPPMENYMDITFEPFQGKRRCILITVQLSIQRHALPVECFRQKSRKTNFFPFKIEFMSRTLSILPPLLEEPQAQTFDHSGQQSPATTTTTAIQHVSAAAGAATANDKFQSK